MREAVVTFILGFNYFIGAYFGVMNTIYACLLVMSLFSILQHIQRIKYAPIRDFNLSSQTPPVSILIPVHNEVNVVCKSVRAALTCDYPLFEVIVINDGSQDDTLRTVIEKFRLTRIDRVYRE